MAIYFLKPRRIDVVKIGRSNNVELRLHTIQGYLPYRIEYSKLIHVSVGKSGSEIKAEALIHRALKKYKTEVKNEWYILNEIVKSLIRRLKANKIYTFEEVGNILVDLKIMKKTLTLVRKPRNMRGFRLRKEFAQSQMKDLNLTIIAVKEKSGLSINTIRSALFGYNTSKETAKKLTTILECKFSDLVTYSKEKLAAQVVKRLDGKILHYRGDYRV